MIGQPGQDVSEPGLRIDVVHLAGGIDGGGAVFPTAPSRSALSAALTDAAVVEEAGERCPAVEQV